MGRTKGALGKKTLEKMAKEGKTAPVAKEVIKAKKVSKAEAVAPVSAEPQEETKE